MYYLLAIEIITTRPPSSFDKSNFFPSLISIIEPIEISFPSETSFKDINFSEFHCTWNGFVIRRCKFQFLGMDRMAKQRSTERIGRNSTRNKGRTLFTHKKPN
jgi:hypothetical protein